MNRSALVVLAALVVLLGGCAQAILPSDPGPAGGPGLTALTVTPPSAIIPGVAQQQFTAKTGDGSKPAVNWSINGIAGGNATLGTISANGMYTAPEFPPTPNSITISAVETSDVKKLGNAAATLNNPVPQLTTVAPPSIPQGAFTITLTGLHFAQTAVAYMGTTALTTTYVSSTQLTAAGTATSAQAGTQIITVHNPDPGASVSAGVNLIVQGGVAVMVAPATAMVRTGNQQAFTVMVTGALNTSVTWTVNGVAGGNSTIGTIAANGAYTAPLILPTPNTVTVTATSVEDPTKSSSATVTLENALPVISSVTPTVFTANTQFEMTVNGTGFTAQFHRGPRHHSAQHDFHCADAIDRRGHAHAGASRDGAGHRRQSRSGRLDFRAGQRAGGRAEFQHYRDGFSENRHARSRKRAAIPGDGDGINRFERDVVGEWSELRKQRGRHDRRFGKLHRAKQYRGPRNGYRNGDQQREFRKIGQRRCDADQSGAGPLIDHSLNLGARIFPDHV